MLKNRRYIGDYQYRYVLIPDGIPAIVPKELFDRVQEKIEKKKNRRATKPSVIKRLLLQLSCL